MIKNKQDYKAYLKADKLALGIHENSFSILRELINPNPIWRFQKLMRKTAYHKNTAQHSPFHKLLYLYYKRKYKHLSIKLGFSIPENAFGPGLCIVHYGTIVVNGDAKIGANCRIHPCTVIGASGGVAGAPQIGNNVYIAPGAKIYGNITLSHNIAIAANAAVNKSFDKEHTLIGGVPAKELGEINIKQIIKHI